MAHLIPDNLKSRSDVPASIRRVASAFQVGLDESVICWYEPLYDREGQKPHFVVLLPDRGIGVFEVLDLKSDSFLGVFRSRLRLVRDGREVEVENPLVRAHNLAEKLHARIDQEPRLKHLQLSVAAGSIFPYLTAEEARTKGGGAALKPQYCIFKEEIDAALSGTGEAVLLRAFSRILGSPMEESVSSDLLKVVRGLTQPEIVIAQIGTSSAQLQLQIFSAPKDEDDIVRVMDLQQETMAKSLGDGHRVIRGVAGSGKTLILVYRARLMAKAFPQHRFLLTCFTRSLAGQLRELLKDNANVDVDHLDSIMGDVIRGARLINPGYKDDDTGDSVAQVALEGLSMGVGPRYQGVFLDEAQDFGTLALRFAAGLLEEGRDDLVVVADAAQNIFRRKFSWKQAGIQAQGRTRILRINYRNTREILEFANRFLLASKLLHCEEVPDAEDENAVIAPESAARSGPRPQLQIVSSAKEEVEKTFEQVLQWSKIYSSPRQIGVLYSASRDQGINRPEALIERLRSAGINVFWLSDRYDTTARNRLAQAKEPVILTSIHSAKGLEFPHVVLCGIWSDRGDAEAVRKLAYVGMTRATNTLTVVTREGHPLIEDLRLAISL